jgi:hypothetical protein
MADLSWMNTWLGEVIAKRKADIAATNSQSVSDYESKCSQWIVVNLINRDKGLPYSPLPDIPHKQLVDDAGTVSDGGPFPDLKPPVLPPLVTPTGDGHSIAAPTIDKQDVMLLMLKALLDDTSALRKALKV